MMATHMTDSALFNKLSKRKMTNYLLDYVTQEFESIISCPSSNIYNNYYQKSSPASNPQQPKYNNHRNSLPSPPLSSYSDKRQQEQDINQPMTPPLPPPETLRSTENCQKYKLPMSLRSFIETIIKNSRIDTGTLLISLSYARRLRSKLYHTSKGMECTHHRIFLATVIITYKYIHDSTIKNKYWARYSLNIFSNTEINLMEKQLLQLLDYNLEISIKDFESIANNINQLYLKHQNPYPTPPYTENDYCCKNDQYFTSELPKYYNPFKQSPSFMPY